ncbi:DNA polymerase III subunit delta' [Actimicrobium sp. CCI2.3]|uniref:DNA polymerase III subunit delta' n=1 Tax=Actimicrobium sp. CCI2.3 TaxID=3048616 RepID=UPI002AB3E17B|nr:DNA polymerase III subunit delta' [Actimicrobium sp. CCI2.3]MDY7572900.1 DNA polymerase III subunit delta' [Actimicrobium sp. CCI2.3]MEB0020745.1 DNA polymerase III subunit delta' [Actimicrobium sp. CCI2.3]
MAMTIYPWQQDAWQQLHALRGRLPHAILLHGNRGVGKTDFAEAYAASLLCESPLADGRACGSCLSCGWFGHYAHPDYRRVRPEILDGGDVADDSEDVDAGDEKKTAKSSKTPSKEIRIEQIRALADFMNISTHRSGKRVVLLYPAEALNTISANALLKTLEEPPPDTVFLMVSNSLDRLLPTILSRCRQFALPTPSTAVALAWLAQQQVRDGDMWLAEQGGAPLAARELAQAGSHDHQDELLGMLARPSVEAALKVAEKLQKTPVVELVVCLQRWLHDMFSVKLSGKVRYYPRRRDELIALGARVALPDLLKAIDLTRERRAIAQHPLAARLFIEDMLLDYSHLFS